MDALREDVNLNADERALVDAWQARLAALTIPCPLCGGEGSASLGEADYEPCPACNGGAQTDGWTALKVWTADVGDWDDIDEATKKIVQGAATGEAVTLLRSRRARCPLCRGAGSGNGGYDCQACNAQGWVSGAVAALMLLVPCPHCSGDGSGGVPGMGWDCGYCGGVGSVTLEDAENYHEEWYERRRPYATAWEAIEAGNIDGAFEWFTGKDIAPYMGIHGDWTNRDYSQLDLSGVTITRAADFSDSGFDDLDGSDFSLCTLDGCSIGSARRANLAEASMIAAGIGDCDGGDFTSADLSDAEFGGSCRNATFTGANLANAVFAGTDLTGSTIEEAVSLEGTRFSDATGLSPIQRAACLSRGAVFEEEGSEQAPA